MRENSKRMFTFNLLFDRFAWGRVKTPKDGYVRPDHVSGGPGTDVSIEINKYRHVCGVKMVAKNKYL
jgi:hypothetical protein